MMKKISLSFIAGIIAFITIVFNFFQTSETTSFLMFEVNNWTYRLIWTIIGAGCFYDHFKKPVDKQSDNSAS